MSRGPKPKWKPVHRTALFALLPTCGKRLSDLTDGIAGAKSSTDVRAYCLYYADELGKPKLPSTNDTLHVCVMYTLETQSRPSRPPSFTSFVC
jgi:hypothetical protein